MQKIIQTAFEARLSPLAGRVAVIVADIAGSERALRFIKSCRLEDEFRAGRRLNAGAVLV